MFTSSQSAASQLYFISNPGEPGERAVRVLRGLALQTCRSCSGSTCPATSWPSSLTGCRAPTSTSCTGSTATASQTSRSSSWRATSPPASWVAPRGRWLTGTGGGPWARSSVSSPSSTAPASSHTTSTSSWWAGSSVGSPPPVSTQYSSLGESHSHYLSDCLNNSPNPTLGT